MELHANLKKTGYHLLRHDTATEPGRVGHFVAVQHDQKLAIIAIKGTSTLSDALTDILGKAVAHTLSSPLEHVDKSGDSVKRTITQVCVHEGMYAAAQLLCDDTQHLVEHFFVPQGYRVVVTGHSLGAGVACLLGLFLRARVQAMATDNDRLRVVAFATPPCLDLTACQAMTSFCTSVVNNTDCIPRASVPNLVHLHCLLKRINDKLVEQGRAPKSNWRAFYKDLIKIDDQTLLTPQELIDAQADILKATTQTDEDVSALFVPGRTLVLWKEGGDADKDNDTRNFKAIVGDGSLDVLRHLEVETTMISDHPCLKYKENLGLLLEQLQQQEANK